MNSGAVLRVGAALLTALVALACDGSDSQDGQVDSVMREALEQLGYVEYSGKADDRAGVILHDRARAWPGYNLFTNDAREARLMDMDGRIVHRWRAPEKYERCEYFELLDDGGIALICVAQAMVRLDADSKVVWEVAFLAHHDVQRLPDGGFLVPSSPPAPRAYRERQVGFDHLLRISSAGKVVGRWRVWDHLADLQARHEPLPLDAGELHPLVNQKLDYYHLNAVQVLPDTPLGRRDPRFRAGHWLVSLRNANLIVVVDPETGSIVWSWGPREIELQHMPRMLDSGMVLIFDNRSSGDFSRVIELDPESEQIIWEYRGDPPESFFTKWRGSSQRLPNGNTLIGQSGDGRIFEVTPEGEIVWEYWSTDFHKDGRKGIYRMLRLAPERVLAALPHLKAGALAD